MITSDHGEVLDEERCSYQHERTISEHVLRVPLVRWSPGIAPRQIDDMVGLMDVGPMLAGQAPSPRKDWVAQSGMCEPDCAPGCAPTGLSGRDSVVLDDGGRMVDRPGRGRFSVGSPSESLEARLDALPDFKGPSGPGSDAAESLGYLDPL